ncbi:MAG: GAF domain-containing protein, partial [Chloroflexota bacterium]
SLLNRATQLETVAQVGLTTLTILDPTQLLVQVVNLAKERFNLYHAHVYQMDDIDNMLTLVAGSGDIGEKMVEEGWRIALDTSYSIVANVARTGEGAIVNDVKQDENFLANRFLPNTKSELAVPLRIGQRILGVLDVQSDKLNAFNEQDIQIQNILAAQVAIALENARLFAQIERQVKRETLVNKINERIQLTTSVESALQTTVQELAQALQSQQVQVKLHGTSHQ